MVYVITRLCRDCVDGACVDVCPVDCILEHRAAEGEASLPNQLFIDPSECIHCSLCEPACPWQAVYAEGDVPAAFDEDIALNALSARRDAGFHVPLARLAKGASREEAEANRERWLTASAR